MVLYFILKQPHPSNRAGVAVANSNVIFVIVPSPANSGN